MHPERNIVLTGPGRSGTTLACYLLNKLPDAVALAEPITPGKFEHLMPDVEAVCDGIERFYRRMRTMALEQGVVISKHVDGVVPDNTKGAGDGVRQRIAKKGKIPVGKDLSSGFYLVIKQPGLFTALLPALAKRFPCYAIVRNPLAKLASGMSIPRREGARPKPPAGRRYNPGGLRTRMKGVENDPVSRRLATLDYKFGRYIEFLPPENVVRYEDIVRSGGKALGVIVPSASHLDEPLELRNLNPLYDRDVMLRLGEKLLASEGAYWRFYSKESVEELLAAL
jgi:hypothetical protein